MHISFYLRAFIHHCFHAFCFPSVTFLLYYRDLALQLFFRVILCVFSVSFSRVDFSISAEPVSFWSPFSTHVKFIPLTRNLINWELLVENEQFLIKIFKLMHLNNFFLICSFYVLTARENQYSYFSRNLINFFVSILISSWFFLRAYSYRSICQKCTVVLTTNKIAVSE